jgi:hypothetical protein
MIRGKYFISRAASAWVRFFLFGDAGWECSFAALLRENLFDARKFFAGEIQIPRRARAIVHLLHLARADERARHRLVPQQN